MYLGTNVRRRDCTNENRQDTMFWGLGTEPYTKEALRIFDRLMGKWNLEISSTRRNGRKTPFSNSDCRPELDCTLYCGPELLTVYQYLIQTLR